MTSLLPLHIIIRFKRLSKNQMIPFYNQGIFYYPFVPAQPLQPLLYPMFPSGHPTSMSLNCYGNANCQSQQRSELSQLRRENETINLENEQLRASDADQTTRVKRKYRKRRHWLEKKFRCNYKDCKKKYASKIALNSHKRKKHPSESLEVK